MSTEDNKAASQRIGEAINARDFDAFKECMSPTMYEEFSQELRDVLAAFPDYMGKNIDMFAEGDKIAVRWTAVGTHHGSFMGIAPTGKQVSFRGISIDQYADGKLIKTWIEMDMLGVLQQLGVVPAPGQAS